MNLPLWYRQLQARIWLLYIQHRNRYPRLLIWPRTFAQVVSLRAKKRAQGLNQIVWKIWVLLWERGAVDCVQEVLSYLLHGDGATGCDHAQIVILLPDHGHAWRRWPEEGMPPQHQLNFRYLRQTARIGLFCPTCGKCADLEGAPLMAPEMGKRVGEPARKRWPLRILEAYTNREAACQGYLYLAFEIFSRKLHGEGVLAPNVNAHLPGPLGALQALLNADGCKYSRVAVVAPGRRWRVSALGAHGKFDTKARLLGSVKTPKDLVLMCGVCFRAIDLTGRPHTFSGGRAIDTREDAKAESCQRCAHANV
jgi:hypothetical protein